MVYTKVIIMNIEIIDRDIVIHWFDHHTSDQVKDIIRYSVDIMEGGMTSFDDHYIWDMWKEKNCLQGSG